MSETDETRERALKALTWPLRLTRLGMVAERATRAFWPFWSVVLLGLAALAFGLHDMLPRLALWAVLAFALCAALWSLLVGIRAFRWPDMAEAVERLDHTLPGRPITALSDRQAIGAGDSASESVWRVHVARMSRRMHGVRPVPADLRVSRRDPYGLRYVAVTAFVTALIFGSFWRVAELPDAATNGGAALAAGPAWEGWVEPPAYTGKPSLYLNDISEGPLSVPKGSQVTLRLYGEVGALSVRETVSATSRPQNDSDGPAAHSFEIAQSGEIAVDGPGGRAWNIAISPDTPPSVAFQGGIERQADGEMRQGFTARDDFGVEDGTVTVTLDMDRLERRHGLAADPEQRAPIMLDLPMPITGDRRDFSETIVENLSKHPWVGLPVRMTITAKDALGQQGRSDPLAVALPGRRFFDPLADAIAEQRRDLLWTRQNGTRVAQILRAISYQPEDMFRDMSAYLQLRVAIRRLEAGIAAGLTGKTRDAIAEALWDIAVSIEDGDLSSALERLRRAQERLSEAMRKGASDDEIAKLMEEMRQAMQDYMRQLAQQQQQQGNQQAQNQQNMQEITGEQLQQMLDRLQELMEQGRMAEAQQLLNQLNQMMQNMQVTQGQGQQQSPGEQAMEGLAETLRDQQGLSDQAFRDLQEQFNQGGQAGQSGENEGQSGGQGRGQSHQGQQGEGQGQQGGDQGAAGQPSGQDLAQRQQALREELRRQQQTLPGLGGEQGQATREALDRAGRAMEQAERALREDDLAGALDNQSEAMEALREGMRNLGEALAQQQQQGSQGQAMGRGDPGNLQRDPLGRERGAQGAIGSEENMLNGNDAQGRARELLDELRRRSSDRTRPELELDYLRRLLERF